MYEKTLIEQNSYLKKRVLCILRPYIIHLKTPVGKNWWYDISLCWYCLIKNFVWETSWEKTHKKKRVQYSICNKLSFRETLPLILANLKVNLYQPTQHIWNVEYDRFVNISARLSQNLVCKCSYIHATYVTELS